MNRELNVLADDPRQHAPQVLRHGVEIDPCRLRVMPPAERQQLTRQRRATLARPVNFLEVAAILIVIGMPFEHQLDVAKGDRQQIIEARTVIHDRIAYRRSGREGLAVSELSPPDRKAAAEVSWLYKEVFDGA